MIPQWRKIMNKIRLKEKLNSQKGITGIDMVI